MTMGGKICFRKLNDKVHYVSMNGKLGKTCISKPLIHELYSTRLGERLTMLSPE